MPVQKHSLEVATTAVGSLPIRLLVLAMCVVGCPAASFAQSYEAVYSFAGPGRDPQLPVASLIQASDGLLYGTSAAGGVSGTGTVFRLTLDGTLEVVSPSVLNGTFPLAPLILATDGRLYGTLAQLPCISIIMPGPLCHNPLWHAEADGPSSGATFALTTGGAAAFAPNMFLAPDRPAGDPHFVAQGPVSVQTPFLQTADGALLLPYVATTTLTPPVRGYISRSKLDGTALPGAYLPPTGGATGPGTFGPTIQATDGTVYGTTSKGGASNAGTIFKMTTGLTATFVYEFTGGAAGATPRSIIQASDGNFYGTTEAGGDVDAGTVFRMAPNATVTVLHSFNGDDGRAPAGALIQASDGNFYGTAANGGAFDRGVVYRMALDGTVTVLYSFGRDPLDGESPQAGLFQATDGNFYGTTKLGGNGVGTVFRITPDGVLTILVRFGASDDGGTPTSPLMLAADGNLYGMTIGGYKSLDFESGGYFLRETRSTLYRVKADHSVERLRILDERFGGPVGGLVQGNDGNLFGVTVGGAPASLGTVFKTTTQGVLTLLHAFAGSPGDGATPASLVKTADGNFLGTTAAGGAFGKGTVFRMMPNGSLTVLHNFAGTPDGERPSESSAPILAADGNYYGTTDLGGSFGEGTIYRLTPGGVVAVVYSFQKLGSFSHTNKVGGLVQGDDGYLYGTILEYVRPGIGNAFRITLDGALTTLHVFTYSQPTGAPLLQAADGAFYGTTEFTGDDAFDTAGTVFRMTRDGVVDVQITFPPPPIGEGPPPLAALVRGPDGAFWGTAGSTVAQSGYGLVYRLDPQAAPFAPTTLVRASTSQGVSLTWSRVLTAATYTIKRSESSGAETVLASGVQGTTFVDATAERGRFYYYTVTAVHNHESDSSYEVSVRAGQRALNDFDGDGKTDPAVYRPSTGDWLYTFSAPTATKWGATRIDAPVAGDIPVPIDWDGDGKTDLLMYRSSTQQWFIAMYAWKHTWGISGDIPVPGDFDGDGKGDLAVYRPSTGYWLIRPSSDFNNWRAYRWGGEPGDIPVPADYDGDGMTDPAIYRPSNGYWFVLLSSQHFEQSMMFQWGVDGDVPVPGDYDGDGLTDIAVYRPSTGHWLIRPSSDVNNWVAYQWGLDGDVPVPGDYDGDGKIDVAVYRPSTGYWIVLTSRSNFTEWTATWWGVPGDIPLVQPR